MTFSVREMTLDETWLRINYFHKASPEYLILLGVDQAKLPDPDAWYQKYKEDAVRPIHTRVGMNLIWLQDDIPVGMSSADNIQYGQQAFMHLHVLDSNDRKRGMGTIGVQESVRIYFKKLDLKKLFCQPNAYNIAPNRALQKAGFRYDKTFETVPGPINMHQTVTRWVFERDE